MGNSIPRTIYDDLGRKLNYFFPLKRIISLVPSITELLFDIGLENEIVGVTKFCISPQKAQEKIIVGGTKKADLKIIEKLKPDLIFAEKSENSKENILNIAKNFNVFIFDIQNFDDAIKFIKKTGDITGKNAESRLICDKIIQSFIESNINFENKTIFFPIWKNPFYTINKNTFVNSMLETIGLKNVFSEKTKNYPTVSKEEISSKSPNFIFLPSEPYHFTEKDKNEFQELCPNSKIINVKGEMFMWYGSRMQNSVNYFRLLKKELSS